MTKLLGFGGTSSKRYNHSSPPRLGGKQANHQERATRACVGDVDGYWPEAPMRRSVC